MAKRLAVLVALLLATRLITSSVKAEADAEIPGKIVGVELSAIRGWLGHVVPWVYRPEHATVHPLPSLWQPSAFQSPGEVEEQCWVLNQYGSGADVLQYNPNLNSPDHNRYLSTFFEGGPECTRRRFFLLYENVFGTLYETSQDGSHNMDLEYNRQVFRNDVEWMVREVILKHQSRYVMLNGKALIYLWSVVSMTGDLASLLDEVRAKYPVSFIGGINLSALPTDAMNLRNFAALDGFMEYNSISASGNYVEMSTSYDLNSRNFRKVVAGFQKNAGGHYIFIPTFQPAFDDSKLLENRNHPVMYPRTLQEMANHAILIKKDMAEGVYSNLGPFVVFNEPYEGAAVIPSQCIPETLDRPGRFVGCGYVRIELVRKYFGPDR